ncbi:MAG TPA: hypothetical protein VHH36_01960, partial [Candidatus Thermoplasmatota archaeon]|nr:hypothetical protein [Candidatus Thermoplasmatota archaeon]
MTRPALPLLLAALLAAPAAASWGVGGAREPDTAHDLASGMPGSADQGPEGRVVYFNLVAMQGGSAGPSGWPLGGANPNALPGMRVAPALAMRPIAYLGVWKDCDRDGYVGHGASALLEYRSELLPDRNTCPEGGEFNADGWVFEFRWLVPDPGRFATSARAIVDPGAAVWADHGPPGAKARVACPMTPAPEGTFASTGGLLRYADCHDERFVAETLSRADGDLGTRLFFEDPGDPQADCEAALAVDLRLYANPRRCPDEGPGRLEDADDPMLTAWDCDAPPLAAARDPTGAPGGRGAVAEAAEAQRPGTTSEDGAVKHPLY